MTMNSSAARITLLALLSLATPLVASAGGLRCSVGEVVLENLKISQTYSLRTLANLPLTLTNTGDHSVTVALDPMVPGESELRGGAEPIGSLAWVSVMPETLTLEAGQTATADVSLVLPDDETLFGRRFQAMVWSHTLPDPNDLVSVGLKSRIIFSVDTERDSSSIAPTGELGIELESAELKLSGLKARKAYRLQDLMTRPMSVRNTSSRTLTIELAPAAVPVSEASEAGDLLAVAQLRFDPAVVVLAPGERRAVTGTLTVNEPAKLRGQRLRCAVSASVTDLAVRTRILSRIVAVAR